MHATESFNDCHRSGWHVANFARSGQVKLARLVPSPLYPGERVRVRGSFFFLFLILFLIREEEED